MPLLMLLPICYIGCINGLTFCVEIRIFWPVLCECDLEATGRRAEETDSASAESRRDAHEGGSETPARDGDEDDATVGGRVSAAAVERAAAVRAGSAATTFKHPVVSNCCWWRASRIAHTAVGTSGCWASDCCVFATRRSSTSVHFSGLYWSETQHTKSWFKAYIYFHNVDFHNVCFHDICIYDVRLVAVSWHFS